MASLRGVQTCLGMVAPSTGSSAFHFNVSGKYRIRQNYPTSVAKGSEGVEGALKHSSQAEKSLLPLSGLRECFLPFGRSVFPSYGWATRPGRRRI